MARKAAPCQELCNLCLTCDVSASLRLQKHKPVACDRGPSRAIDAGKLCDFHSYFQEAIGKRNMSLVPVLVFIEFN